jgi:formylglycine-generating enzyme required for sulfatase activity
MAGLKLVLSAFVVLGALADTAAVPAGAQSAISAGGVVESTSGGFKFPDGTIQTTAAGSCPVLDPTDEMISVGGVCIDKYEASLWDAPVGGSQITGEIPCSPNGQNCDNIYARSVAGVQPRSGITWFQALAALANVGKRLPTNAEWQMAVMETPDPGNVPGPADCNTTSAGPDPTGSRVDCVSRWGAFDMVGNVSEWVADWDEGTGGCTTWLFGDGACVGSSEGDPPNRIPSGFVRGGHWGDETFAGPFAIDGGHPLLGTDGGVGFRGAR